MQARTWSSVICMYPSARLHSGRSSGRSSGATAGLDVSDSSSSNICGRIKSLWLRNHLRSSVSVKLFRKRT